MVWRTNKKAVSWVELAPDDGTHFYREERPQFFESNFGRKVIGQLHKIRIKGLQPGTAYRYRIYSKEVMVEEDKYIQYGKVAASAVYKAEPFLFRTPGSRKDETSFAMVNDIHENPDLLEALVNQALPEQPDFFIFNGDRVGDMRSEQQILDGFLTRSVELFAAETLFYFARGNHVTRGVFSTEYSNYFPTQTGQPYYSFRQGPAFFVVLDGGEDKPDSDIEYPGLGAFDEYREEQATWIENRIEIKKDNLKKQTHLIVFLLRLPTGFLFFILIFLFHSNYQIVVFI